MALEKFSTAVAGGVSSVKLSAAQERPNSVRLSKELMQSSKVTSGKVLTRGAKEHYSDLISDGCKVKRGDAPYLNMHGAGEVEPT